MKRPGERVGDWFESLPMQSGRGGSSVMIRDFPPHRTTRGGGGKDPIVKIVSIGKNHFPLKIKGLWSAVALWEHYRWAD
jgi:hypothetical protein